VAGESVDAAVERSYQVRPSLGVGGGIDVADRVGAEGDVGPDDSGEPGVIAAAGVQRRDPIGGKPVRRG